MAFDSLSIPAMSADVERVLVSSKRAFYWLQEEVLKVSHDTPVLAWTQAEAHFSTTSGIFADSPSCFNQGARYVRGQRTTAGAKSGLGMCQVAA